MSPEAKLADFARRIHLEDGDVDYLIGLLQEARSLGSRAGASAEREQIAALVDGWPRPSIEEIDGTMAEHQPCLMAERSTLEQLAAAVRGRDGP